MPIPAEWASPSASTIPPKLSSNCSQRMTVMDFTISPRLSAAFAPYVTPSVTPAVLLSAFSRKNTAKPTSITTAITAGTSQMLFQS